MNFSMIYSTLLVVLFGCVTLGADRIPVPAMLDRAIQDADVVAFQHAYSSTMNDTTISSEQKQDFHDQVVELVIACKEVVVNDLATAPLRNNAMVAKGGLQAFFGITMPLGPIGAFSYCGYRALSGVDASSLLSKESILSVVCSLPAVGGVFWASYYLFKQGRHTYKKGLNYKKNLELRLKQLDSIEQYLLLVSTKQNFN